NCSPRFCRKVVCGVTLCRIVNQNCRQITLRRNKVRKTLQDLDVSCLRPSRIPALGLDSGPRSECRNIIRVGGESRINLSLRRRDGISIGTPRCHRKKRLSVCTLWRTGSTAQYTLHCL